MLTISVCHPDPLPSDEEVRAGVSAAERLFNERGVSSLEAHRHADRSACGEESPQAQAWHEAEQNALSACFERWQRIPESAHLEYR